MAIVPMKGELNASPAAKAFAKANGVNIKDVTGSGAFGRIVLDDVKAHLKDSAKPAAKPKAE